MSSFRISGKNTKNGFVCFQMIFLVIEADPGGQTGTDFEVTAICIHAFKI
jgi:hypothetical protein